MARDELRHDLGVGLALEFMASGGELGFELLEILDDAVMNDRDFLGSDRMRVGLRWHAMRRPARVADADQALHWLFLDEIGERLQLALGAAALDRAVDEGRDAGRIIAAIFEAAEPVDQKRSDLLPPDDADNAAH